MDPKLKARWVAALRSGDYAQARDALRTEGSHCCLGVLCDIYDPNGWVLDDAYRYDPSGDLDLDDCTASRVLPISLASVLGIDDAGKLSLPDGMRALDNGKEIVWLTELNDDGFTFDQIADLIDYFL